VLVPRATPPETWARWRLVLAANAVTSGVYVVSVNRPAGEPGAAPGGPSVAIAPSGEVLLETTEPLAVVTLERRAAAEARCRYPGYLSVRAHLYAEAWRRAAGATSTAASRT
jgi:predicted amidohydrolase